MTTLLRQIGPLRILLFGITLAIIALAPDGGVTEAHEGWALVPTVLIPALTPMVLMGLLLDAIMSRVWMVSASAEERPRYRRLLWANLAFGTALVIAFIPFIQSLMPE